MRKSKHTVFMKANLLILILTFLSKITPTRQNPQDTGSEQGKMTLCMHLENTLASIKRAGSDVFTTPITAMGCQECLTLSIVQLKGKH